MPYARRHVYQQAVLSEVVAHPFLMGLAALRPESLWLDAVSEANEIRLLDEDCDYIYHVDGRSNTKFRKKDVPLKYGTNGFVGAYFPARPTAKTDGLCIVVMDNVIKNVHIEVGQYQGSAQCVAKMTDPPYDYIKTFIFPGNTRVGQLLKPIKEALHMNPHNTLFLTFSNETHDNRLMASNRVELKTLAPEVDRMRMRRHIERLNGSRSPPKIRRLGHIGQRQKTDDVEHVN